MEHNHTPLIYGFLLSFFMVGSGIILAFIGATSNIFELKIVVYAIGGIIVIGGTIIVKRTFKKRDNCEICREKYHYGRRKSL